ncbi:homogentisate 1,2-dioxygenase [Biscogniauxia sp. FL1348]|nr:homogentisate 1,2-dioxygenase [Biscogniauxia sp. FL1348]
MSPVTNFAVKDTYTYLEGLGNYHQTEAIPGANSKVNNSPQKPAFGLRTERISGSAFTSARGKSYHTWLYRVNGSLSHGDFTPLDKDPESPEQSNPLHLTPNSYLWPQFHLEDEADWTNQKLLARNADPQSKTGSAIWIFSVTKDMPNNTAFCSLDGETLIVPQSGALDIQTELGRLLVRQNEFAVIPSSVRYRVTLPEGRPCRGYICELFQGHWELPNLGVIGSTGSANIRDFQIPTAHFDGEVVEGANGERIAKAHSNIEAHGDWTILSRLSGRLWSCKQDRTPFDVVAWHGTCYPYKYDFARFCIFANAMFDEHDPSLYIILTAPAYGSAPGTAAVDFGIVPTRWQMAEDTFWPPYYHRNTMQEFIGAVVSEQDRDFPLNNGSKFQPFGAGTTSRFTPHGPTETEFAAARKLDTMTPQKVQNEGFIYFFLETEKPLYLTDWAYENAVKNYNGKGGSYQ